MRAPFLTQSASKLSLTGVSFNASLEPAAGNPTQTYQKSRELNTPGYYLEPYQREVAWADMNNIPAPEDAPTTSAYWLTAYLMNQIASSGYLIAPCYTENRVEIINPSNFSHVATFGSAGDGTGQFNGPYGCCSDGTYIYIGENLNGRIQKFALSGFTYITGTPTGFSTADGRFTNPAGMDTDGIYLYVADAGNNRIQKLNCSDLSFVAKTGGTTAGAGNDQFNWPLDVQINGSNLFVADYGNHRFVKRDTNLVYVTKTGSNSQTVNGNFYYPRQINIIDNYLYLTDSTKRCQKLDFSFNYIDKCSPPGGSQNWGSATIGEYIYLGCDNEKIYKYNTSLVLQSEYAGDGYLRYFAPVPETVGFGWDSPSLDNSSETLPSVSFSPPSYGALVTTSVTLSCVPTGGITIRYSTDGSDVTLESTAYTTPISASANPTTIKARATSGSMMGPWTSATYTNYTGVNPVIFNPASGEYSGPINLLMSTTTSGSTIYYESAPYGFGVSQPNVGSSLYTGAIPISVNTTFLAKAFKGALSSETTTGHFFVNSSTFDYLNNSTDRTGPWSKMYPDGVNDYCFRTTLDVPAGGWNIKRFEIYQLSADGSSTIGQFWSTDKVVYPITFVDYYRDPRMPKSAYNLLVYSGSTAMNPYQKSYLFDLPSGSYTFDLFATKSVTNDGRFVLCVVGTNDIYNRPDIIRMFSTNHP